MRSVTTSPQTSRPQPSDLGGNRLLKRLSGDEQRRLASRMELVPALPGEILFRPGEAMGSVYFPLDCVVSLRGICGESGGPTFDAVGNEGFVGVSLFMGGRAATHAGELLSGGRYLKLKAPLLRQELRRSLALERLLLRYAQAFITQALWSVQCRGHHDPLKRVCTSILLCGDRLSQPRNGVTIELVAASLDLEAAEVGGILRGLQQLGHVNARGGYIRITGRAGLEAMACRCYAEVRQELAAHVAGRRAALSNPAARL